MPTTSLLTSMERWQRSDRAFLAQRAPLSRSRSRPIGACDRCRLRSVSLLRLPHLLRPVGDRGRRRRGDHGARCGRGTPHPRNVSHPVRTPDRRSRSHDAPYFACAQFQHFARTTEVTDADLVALARDTVEAREFQRRFGVSSTTVDRSGRTAIDFRSGHVRLRVFMADGPRAVDSFLDCPGRRLASTNVVEAIRAAGC
jgi:hypothetical protein